MQSTQFYFNHYPDGVTFSVRAGTVLDSQQVPKPLKIQVLVRTLAPFPLPKTRVSSSSLRLKTKF